MAEATIESVVSELMDINKVLHTTADMHLEALFNIERAVTAVDTKVGLMLEAPAIQDTLKKFSEDIVNGITGSFDAALEYQKKQDLMQGREEDAEVDDPKKKTNPLEKIKASYRKGMKEGLSMPKFMTGFLDTISDLVIVLGGLSSLWQFLKKQKILNVMKNLGSYMRVFGQALSRLALPITAAVAVINGLIDAFMAFTGTEGDLIAKLSSAIRAFFGGIIDVFAFIPDMIKGFVSDGIRAIFGDNFVSDFLDDFSFGDIPKRILDVFITLIEGFAEAARDVIGGLINIVTSTIGGFASGIVDFLEEQFPMIFSGISLILDTISGWFEYLGELVGGWVDGLRSFFNIGDEKKDDDFLNLTNDEQRDELESARRSGLYNKNILTKSEVDPDKIAAASDKQLQAILDDDDINEASKELVENELRERLGPREIDKQMSSESNVTTNNNNSADYFKTERVETEGAIDGTAKLAGDRPGAYYGSVKSARGKTRGEMTRSERASVRAAGDGSARIDTPSPSTTAEAATPSPETVNEITVSTPSAPKQGPSGVVNEVPTPSKATKGTVATAISRPAGEKPNKYVSVDPVSGKYRAFAPNLAATGKDAYGLFDTIKEANEFTKSVDPEHEKMMAAELAAFDAEFGTSETDTAGRISGGQGAAAQSGELASRQNDLSNAQAQQQQSASNVAVVDNSSQQSVVNNNSTSGVNPGPFDRSDRTHKRGSYRGAG